MQKKRLFHLLRTFVFVISPTFIPMQLVNTSLK